jgi:predicted ATPase
MEDIKLKKIAIQNFKSLYDVSFEPGRVNVFIGANGSGKSSVLEAIGVLSAALTDRVNTVSLQRKGVRLSTSSLYKSKFLSIEKESKTIDFAVEWKLGGHDYEYVNHLTVPNDDDSWKYFAENVTRDGESVYGRSNRSSAQLNNKIGYFIYSEALSAPEYVRAAGYIGDYGIFQPDTLTLRGTVADPVQTNPIGLNGGRLAEAIQDLIHEENGDLMFGTMFMEDMLELIDWASEFKVSKPKKTNLHPGVPTTQQIIEFRDRYLKDTASFTGYDASEGALYVLFMLSLAMHGKAPKMFAIDSFDHAMNPRLARKVTEIFSNKIIEENKTVFMTTHNPLVLDGLDLSNDDIRLFTTDRNKQGHVEVRRVQVSEKLLEMGQPLSRLWINGVLGGVPELL